LIVTGGQTCALPICINGPHALSPGDQVYINFTTGSAVDGLYTVASVPDPTHFVVITTNSVSQTQNGLLVYPLSAPPFTRSGNVRSEERRVGKVWRSR